MGKYHKKGGNQGIHPHTFVVMGDQAICMHHVASLW